VANISLALTTSKPRLTTPSDMSLSSTRVLCARWPITVLMEFGLGTEREIVICLLFSKWDLTAEKSVMV
jgi:hypothetical protein